MACGRKKKHDKYIFILIGDIPFIVMNVMKKLEVFLSLCQRPFFFRESNYCNISAAPLRCAAVS
uniref:Uncharacterized protein n=1 Tax=Solanum lycopersicum TaxID=4081 RepID=A0A3Q7ECI8_SOLLC